MIPFEQIAAAFRGRYFWIGPEGAWSFGQFADEVRLEQQALRELPSDEVICADLRWQPRRWARFLAALLAGRHVFAGAAPARRLDVTAFGGRGQLLLLSTGGTTAAPRIVVHAAEAFLASCALQLKPSVRQLVLYAADHLAGIDAFLKAWHAGASLVIPEALTPDAIARAIHAHAIDVLPATPSLLQFLLIGAGQAGSPFPTVRVIPHGAEPMPGALRERLQQAFPHAELRQRFGITELGALPVRPDPADPAFLFLDEPGYAWKVEQDELLIRSPHTFLGYLEEGPRPSEPWYRTGDLVEISPRGSLRVLGRRSAQINVGGHKVLPESIENLLLADPAVAAVKVYPLPHPLTGHTVAADVVLRKPDTGTDAQQLRRHFRHAFLAAGLPLACLPTKWQFVSALELTAYGKRSRAH